MRLAILDNGHTLRMKALFAVIRTMSRLPVPDAIKLNRYRPEFYARTMRTLTQEAMRGSSAWSIADRELMGAIISQANGCEVCTRTHAAVAALASRNEPRIDAALADIETAPIEEPLRATLRLLRNLTRDHTLDPQDIRAVRAAGVSREQLTDALAVSFVFNTVDRLSRTFDWRVAGPAAYRAGARFLLSRGYG